MWMCVSVYIHSWIYKRVTEETKAENLIDIRGSELFTRTGRQRKDFFPPVLDFFCSTWWFNGGTWCIWYATAHQHKSIVIHSKGNRKHICSTTPRHQIWLVSHWKVLPSPLTAPGFRQTLVNLSPEYTVLCLPQRGSAGIHTPGRWVPLEGREVTLTLGHWAAERGSDGLKADDVNFTQQVCHSVKRKFFIWAEVGKGESSCLELQRWRDPIQLLSFPA